MTKNPDECKHGQRFGDIYICRIQTIPCAALNKCALETVDNLSKAIRQLIELVPENTKEASDETAPDP